MPKELSDQDIKKYKSALLKDEIEKRKKQALAAMPKYSSMWVDGHEISMLETEG
mgnify:CR=1 FL=1